MASENPAIHIDHINCYFKFQNTELRLPLEKIGKFLENSDEDIQATFSKKGCPIINITKLRKDIIEALNSLSVKFAQKPTLIYTHDELVVPSSMQTKIVWQLYYYYPHLKAKRRMFILNHDSGVEFSDKSIVLQIVNNPDEIAKYLTILPTSGRRKVVEIIENDYRIMIDRNDTAKQLAEKLIGANIFLKAIYSGGK